MTDFTLTDFDDQPITVGSRVHVWDDEKATGTVESLGEFDGDVDDEGRSRAVYPRVRVRFDDGSVDSFATCEWQHGPAYDDWPAGGKVEELIALVPVEVKS